MSNSIVEFVKNKPLSVSSFVTAAINLAAVLGVASLKDPQVIGAINLALAGFMGLFVTQTVTANNALVGKALGGFAGLTAADVPNTPVPTEVPAADALPPSV